MSTAAAQAAVTPAPTPPASAKLLADKLMNPRGFTFGPDGAIYARIAPDGTRTTVADHLPVVDGPFQATMGFTIMTIPPYPPGAAKVFKITSDGKSPNGPPQVVAAPFMYPGAMRWGPDGLYSTFNTIGTVQGGPAIGANYKIDKIDTGGR